MEPAKKMRHISFTFSSHFLVEIMNPSPPCSTSNGHILLGKVLFPVPGRDACPRTCACSNSRTTTKNLGGGKLWPFVCDISREISGFILGPFFLFPFFSPGAPFRVFPSLGIFFWRTFGVLGRSRMVVSASASLLVALFAGASHPWSFAA